MFYVSVGEGDGQALHGPYLIRSPADVTLAVPLQWTAVVSVPVHAGRRLDGRALVSPHGARPVGWCGAGDMGAWPLRPRSLPASQDPAGPAAQRPGLRSQTLHQVFQKGK